MAARLITEDSGGPLPIPNREDDLESFWHVLLWITLRHCDHQMPLTRIVHTLGLLFDCMYVGGTGQMQGGQFKRDSLMTQLSVTDMRLASKVLNTILSDTAEVLSIRYPSDKTQDQILRIQRMWEQLKLENLTSVDEDFLLFELCRNSYLRPLISSYHPWKYWRTIQDDAEWMEKIFENALENPSADWDTGNANMPRNLESLPVRSNIIFYY